jgi:hypothetical protein
MVIKFFTNKNKLIIYLIIIYYFYSLKIIIKNENF